MKVVFTAIITINSLFALAQYPVSPNLFDETGLRTGHWTVLYDSTWKEVHHYDSVVYYRLIRFEASKPLGKVRDFYKTGMKQWDGYLLSILPDVMDGESNFYHENGKLNKREYNVQGSLEGPSTEYSPEGNLTVKGQYKGGKAQGKWVYYYADGAIQFEQDYKDSQLHGNAVGYHRNGKIQSRSHYLNNLQEGFNENFSEDGKKTDQSNYKEGELDGAYEAYLEDGTLQEKGVYKNDLADGLWTAYHSNGKIEHTGQYTDGKKDKRWTYYHANGKQERTGLLVDDLAEDVWEFYYDNGQLSSKGVFHENKYEGEWISFYANGNKSQHSYYKRDTLNGVSINYYENGKPKSEGNQIMGKEAGPWTYYHENGNKKTEGAYINGTREGIWKYYDIEGILEDIEPYVSGQLHGEVISYYANGKQKSWKTYREGKTEGSSYTYYDNGILEAEGAYLHHEKTGEWEYYSDTAILQYSINYDKDTLNGDFIEYYGNGNKKLKFQLNAGIKYGPLIRYYQDGNIKEIGDYENDVAHGRWIQYDSASRKKSGEGEFIKGKLNGEWVYYDSEGHINSKRYYRSGFEEIRDNIQDSIQHLIDREDFEQAFKAADWMVAVTKRDYHKKSEQSLPLSMKGKIYYAMSDYKQALSWQLKYLKQTQKYEGSLSQNYKTAVHNVASSYHGLKQFDKALYYYEEAIKVASSEGLVENYWSSINNKAYCLYDAGKLKEAAQLFEEELVKSTSAFGSDSSAGWYLRHEAAEYYYDRPDDYDKSYVLFKDLLDDILATNQPDHKLVFACYRRLAYITNYEYHNENESIAFYTDGIAFAERNKMTDLPEYFDLLIELFYIHGRSIETDSLSATTYAGLVNKLMTLTPTNSSAQAKIFQVIGEYYQGQKQYDESLKYTIQSEDALRSAGLENTLRHAAVLQNMAFAQLYSTRSEAEKAESYFIKSIEIRKKINGTSSPYYHKAILALATFYSSSHGHNKTISLLNELNPILTIAKDSSSLAELEYYLGEAYAGKSLYTESLQHYQQAWAIYRVHEKKYANMCYNTLAGIASCYKYLDDYQRAKEYSELAITLTEKYFGANSETHLFSMTLLGDLHFYNSVYSEAIKIYTQVAGGFEKLSGNLDKEYLYSEYKIANTYYAIYDYKKALHLAKKQFDIIDTKLGHYNYSYLNLTVLMGNIYSGLKEFSNAEKYKRESVAIAKKISNTEKYASYLLNLGEFYQQRNRLEEAEEILSEAVKIIHASDYSRSSLAETYLVALARVKNERDKNKEAEELYKEAFDITFIDSLNNPISYVEAGEKLAGFYSKMGRYQNCEDILIRITRFIENKYGKKFYYASVRAELAWNYYKMEKYIEAEKETNELLAISEAEAGSEHWLSTNLHNYLGIIALHHQQFEKAKEQFQFCINAYQRKPTLSEMDQASLSTLVGNKANTELCLGQYSQAGDHLTEERNIRKKSGSEENRIAQIGTQSDWATYYQAIGQYEKAEAEWSSITSSLLQYTDDNFYYMSDEEKALFWRNISGYFRMFHSFAIQQAKTNPAMLGAMYNIQLATKAILLNASNKIKKRILTSSDSAMVNSYYRWTHQREQLSKLYSLPKNEIANIQSQIDSLKNSVNELEKDMNITAEDMTQDQGGQRVTWKQVQSSLEPQEAAIEIVRFKYFDRYTRDSVIYAALVITAETKQAPQLVLLSDGKLLEGRALRLYKNLITSQLKDTISYNNFWASIAQHVSGKSRIYLSLDGVYNQINLNTLLQPDGNFLVSDKNLTILSNTKDLLALKGRRVKRLSNSTASLFGYPTFFLGKQKIKDITPTHERGETLDQSADTDKTGIRPLVGTQEEIKKVEAILRGHKLSTFSFTDEHATEAEIKRVNHPRVLHIATHGFFIDEKNKDDKWQTGDDQNPLLRSGLLLTGASNFLQNRVQLEDENGILTAYEAANLNLDNTDLVVLSACETGRGEVQNGEGVYGLQRAFQTAGVQSIIMSLWKVDDDATQQLMISFYSNWMSGLNKAEALKAAQLELGKKYPHPYYWGAFVMLEN